MKAEAGVTGRTRRQHDRTFKAELVEQCLVPGASVAAVALAGGVNANLLFKWRRDHLRSKRLSGAASSSSTMLVPVQLTTGMDTGVGRSQPSAPTPASAPMAVVSQRAARVAGTIELDIAGAVLRLRGPVDEVSLCSVLRALRHTA